MMSPEAVDLDGLPDDVRERWPVAAERAMCKVAQLADDGTATQLLKASQKASRASQRIVWLHRAASAWARPLESVAACRKGCSHCCHIPLTISSTEAQLIADRLGIQPRTPARSVVLDEQQDFDTAARAMAELSDNQERSACPFLADGACSVYHVRPMACRLLVNLDDDDLLCRRVPGRNVPVPYANSQQLKGLYLLALPATRFADIRAFFPPDATEALATTSAEVRHPNPRHADRWVARPESSTTP